MGTRHNLGDIPLIERGECVLKGIAQAVIFRVSDGQLFGSVYRRGVHPHRHGVHHPEQLPDADARVGGFVLEIGNGIGAALGKHAERGTRWGVTLSLGKEIERYADDAGNLRGEAVLQVEEPREVRWLKLAERSGRISGEDTLFLAVEALRLRDVEVRGCLLKRLGKGAGSSKRIITLLGLIVQEVPKWPSVGLSQHHGISKAGIKAIL